MLFLFLLALTMRVFSCHQLISWRQNERRVCIISVLDADERTIFLYASYYAAWKRIKCIENERTNEKKTKRKKNRQPKHAALIIIIMEVSTWKYCNISWHLWGDHILFAVIISIMSGWLCSVHSVKHSAGVVTPNINRTHFHLDMSSAHS